MQSQNTLCPFDKTTNFFNPPKTLTLGEVTFTPEKAIPLLAKENETPLHTCMRRAKMKEELDTFLAKTDKNKLSDMLFATNQFGKIPLTYMDTSVVKQSLPILKQLLQAMLTTATKPLSDVLDFEKIIEQYPSECNSKRYQHLLLATAIVNVSRQFIKQSATHPTTNNMLETTWRSLTAAVDSLRVSKAVSTNAEGFFKLLLLPFLETHLGNCNEFAILCYFLARLFNPHIDVNIYAIMNGDHGFIMIGKGDDAVICDGWNGDVFPASHILEKLRCHVILELSKPTDHITKRKRYNFSCAIHPNYHIIKTHPDMKHYQQFFNYSDMPSIYLPYQEAITKEMTRLQTINMNYKR